MDKLKDLFKNIKERFSLTKTVDFEEEGLHFELKTLTSIEEMKILEACAQHDGGAFLTELKRSSLAYAIKKINDVDLDKDIIEYQVDGVDKKESKYLFMIKQLDQLPSAFRDILFEAFSNSQDELESIVSKNAKFKRFKIEKLKDDTSVAEASVPKGFKKIEEPKEDEEPEQPTNLEAQK